MDLLDGLIDNNIIDEAYLLLCKKRPHQDEKKLFQVLVSEIIKIHLYKLEDGINQNDYQTVAKEIYNTLKKSEISKEDQVINSVCLSFRHDFGLLSPKEQDSVRFQAKEWLLAWRKHLDC